ncbi:MAG: SDR family oxidoreductase [Gammaproteobacteria bacterium]|nr:SDR family oxidoreductase [Gammaproteobacteria bacterium]NNM12465.1 SDR family oxidoreductase [Pseudomonadales bacterium]RZV52360.1 MAG: SDR family oxidoreductase [Pseudomonadales bacterium]
MDPLLDFGAKSAIITGAGSGFGAALALELAKRGASLVLADINAEGLQVTEAEAKAAGAKVICEVGNVADEAHAKLLVERAQQVFGGIDIAVNNAGIAPAPAAIDQLDAEVLDKQLDVNVKGVAYGLKYQLPAMAAKQGGAVLNVSSMAGLGGAPLVASYAAAKHAVIGLTKTAAFEYARQGVRVNAICPFFTQTPMVMDSEFSTGSVEELDKMLGRSSPMKRIAERDEIVCVMLMMLSPKNTYMNGVAIPVDGGMSAL